jgi:hypothetical protein
LDDAPVTDNDDDDEVVEDDVNNAGDASDLTRDDARRWTIGAGAIGSGDDAALPVPTRLRAGELAGRLKDDVEARDVNAPGPEDSVVESEGPPRRRSESDVTALDERL